MKFSKYKLKAISLCHQEDRCLIQRDNGVRPMSLQELLKPNGFCPRFKVFPHFAYVLHADT